VLKFQRLREENFMPIVKTGRNSFKFDYKLPKRKKNLMTKEFLQTFKEELDNVFNKDNYPEVRNYWNFYFHMEGTCGFYEALKSACIKHNLTKAIYEYVCKMPYYDGDLFDDELVWLMVERGIIKEGDVSETFDDNIYYENNDDFELVITETKLKDCTVIHKNWVLTKECKEKLGIRD